MTYKLGCKSIQHHPTVDTTTVNPIVSPVTNQQKHWESTIKCSILDTVPSPKSWSRDFFGGHSNPRQDTEKLRKPEKDEENSIELPSWKQFSASFWRLEWSFQFRGIPVRYSIPYTSVFPV
jgi:hypothetical protein